MEHLFKAHLLFMLLEAVLVIQTGVVFCWAGANLLVTPSTWAGPYNFFMCGLLLTFEVGSGELKSCF